MSKETDETWFKSFVKSWQLTLKLDSDPTWSRGSDGRGSLGPCPARRRRVAGVDALGALPRVAQLGVDLKTKLWK